VIGKVVGYDIRQLCYESGQSSLLTAYVNRVRDWIG
jgi:hypothetical protein